VACQAGLNSLLEFRGLCTTAPAVLRPQAFQLAPLRCAVQIVGGSKALFENAFGLVAYQPHHKTATRLKVGSYNSWLKPTFLGHALRERCSFVYPRPRCRSLVRMEQVPPNAESVVICHHCGVDLRRAPVKLTSKAQAVLETRLLRVLDAAKILQSGRKRLELSFGRACR